MNEYKITVQGEEYFIPLDKINTGEMFEEAKRRLDEVIAKNATANQLLKETTAHNNKGIESEKLGRINEAINIYEENIAIGYPATLSFDRLMILYRRNKDYKNEIRVCNRAIDVFFAENQRRAEVAIEAEPSKEDEIMNALISCKKVMGSHGFYCFVPFDVVAMRDRLHKAEILLTKQQEGM